MTSFPLLRSDKLLFPQDKPYYPLMKSFLKSLQADQKRYLE